MSGRSVAHSLRLKRRLRDLAAQSGQPATATFELTSRCNLRCAMCYIAGEESCAGSPAELPAAAWVELARQAREAGLVYLTLTGGEALSRPDFFDILGPLTRMGLVLALYSNATLITEDIADRLAETRPNRVEVSLYGATEATYEAVTGVPGSYARCLQGLDRLLARGLPVVLKSTLTCANAHELSAMRELAESRGVLFVAGAVLFSRIDGQPWRDEGIRLSAEDAARLAAQDMAARKVDPELRQNARRPEPVGAYRCPAGRSRYLVDSGGAMHVCSLLRQPGAKPLEVGFAQAWRQLGEFVAATPPADAECQDCSLRPYCSRCPGWSYRETGSLTAPVPYLCQLAEVMRARRQADG